MQVTKIDTKLGAFKSRSYKHLIDIKNPKSYKYSCDFGSIIDKRLSYFLSNFPKTSFNKSFTRAKGSFLISASLSETLRNRPDKPLLVV